MLKNNIGNLLKEARKKNKFTQQQLADRYLSDRQLISNYERGISIPNVENFILLLDILNTPVLIENGEAKIVEVKTMENSKKESRDLRIEYLNFNLDTVLKEYYIRRDRIKNECIKKSIEIDNLARTKGLDIYSGYGFTDDMWHVDCSKEGIAFSVFKDNKEIQVEVEKSGNIDIFNLEAFIEDIEKSVGKGVSDEIFKIICFDAYTYTTGRDIFELFKNISIGVVENEDEISNLLPMIDCFKDIIFNQLKSKNYIEKVYELNLPSANIPVSYLLEMYDEYQSNNLWVKLVLDDYEEVYEPEPFESGTNGTIVDACEYAVNIFDEFDKLFKEWQDENNL